MIVGTWSHCENWLKHLNSKAKYSTKHIEDYREKIGLVDK